MDDNQYIGHNIGTGGAVQFRDNGLALYQGVNAHMILEANQVRFNPPNTVSLGTSSWRIGNVVTNAIDCSTGYITTRNSYQSATSGVGVAGGTMRTEYNTAQGVMIYSGGLERFRVNNSGIHLSGGMTVSGNETYSIGTGANKLNYVYCKYVGNGGSDYLRFDGVTTNVTGGGSTVTVQNGFFYPRYTNAVVDNGWSSNRWKTIYAQNPLDTPSDGRLKMEVEELPKKMGLRFIKKLCPKQYKYISDGPNGKVRYGFIAQDVAELKALPDKCALLTQHWHKDADEKSDELHDEWAMSYTELISPLVAAVQDLNNDVVSLKRELTKLKKQVKDLQK